MSTNRRAVIAVLANRRVRAANREDRRGEMAEWSKSHPC